jgi:hypothetical protein
MKPSKAELMMRLATLAAKGGAPLPKKDDTPRWKDGSAKDPLTRLEESIDLDRLLGTPVLDETGAVVARQGADPQYQDEHMGEWAEWLRLTAQREAEGRQAETRQVELDRLAAAEAYERQHAENTEAARAEESRKRQAIIDEWYATGGKSPAPKDVP